MKNPIQKATAERLLCILLSLCFLAFLLVLAVLNFQCYDNYCNSDVYADSQLAKMMWEQKTLFPQGWGFGNQYYIIATPVLSAIMYGITGNMNTAMILATEVMTILIFLSLLWLFRSFSGSMLHYLLACMILICAVTVPGGPFSLYSMLFFSQASFYACYLITMFFIFGDYIRTIHSPKPRRIAWTVSLLLCFATGMQSLRQTVIMILPLLACELFFACRRICQHKKPWDKEQLRPLIRTISYGLANLAGVVAIKLLNVPSTTVYGQMTASSANQLPVKLQAIGLVLRQITNIDFLFKENASRIMSLGILFFIVVVLIAAFFWIYRIREQESGLMLCWLLFVVGIAGIFLSTVVLELTLRDIYAFMWFPLVAFSGLIVLEKLPFKAQYGAIFLICVLCFGSFCRAALPAVRTLFNRTPTAEMQMSQWAMDHGYEYIYGDYWGGTPQIAVCSEGAIVAGCWHGENRAFKVEPFNTPQNIYTAEENEKALYILTPKNEAEALEHASEAGADFIKVAEFQEYRAYISSIPLMYTD